ncbi:MAG: hypothetical protein ACE5HJ_09095 [Thermoplasmata archaeon]
MDGTPTWQLLASALTAITGILLIAGAFSPSNPAPFPAIVGSGVIMIALSVYFLRLHLAFVRGQRGDGE